VLFGWIDSARSPIFGKILETKLMQEGLLEGTIILDDNGAKKFEFLLKFIYTGSLGSVVGLDYYAVKEILDACSKVKYGDFV
jgi:hypothetical protein